MNDCWIQTLDNLTTLGYFLGAVTSMRCLRTSLKNNYFDEKSCLSVSLNYFKRLFRLLDFLTLRFDAS